MGGFEARQSDRATSLNVSVGLSRFAVKIAYENEPSRKLKKDRV
jgi:hypothetical protein